MDPLTLAFVGVATVLTISPGPDMALVTKNALARGWRHSAVTTLGIALGVFAWGAGSAVGVAALVATSPTAFDVLRFGGAFYLVFLGVRALRSSIAVADADVGGSAPRIPLAVSFREGLVTNLLNPKVGIFYATLLPQFIAPGDDPLLRSLVLAGIHNLLGLVWMNTYAFALTRAARRLAGPSIQRRLQQVTGVALIGLGLRIAVERR